MAATCAAAASHVPPCPAPARSHPHWLRGGVWLLLLEPHRLEELQEGILLFRGQAAIALELEEPGTAVDQRDRAQDRLLIRRLRSYHLDENGRVFTDIDALQVFFKFLGLDRA